jgi:ankyrin repeat protein
VDQLTAMVVPAQVKNALSKMFKVPQDTSQSTNAYDEQYDLALERISTQPTYQADLARGVLAWMTFACRPLTPAELCTALAMSLSEDKSELDPDYLPDVSLLVSICAGLVTIDEEANVVRPAHYTTQEYLERTHRKWFPDGQKQTATTCISYLSMEKFKKGALGVYVDEGYDEALVTYPLLDYAARYWGKHIQPFEADMVQEITAFIEDIGILENISSIANSWRESEYGASWREWYCLTPMRAIASEGLSSTFEKYLKDGLGKVWPDPEEAQYRGRGNPYAPLQVAAMNGHVQLVRLFLDQPSDTGLWAGSGGALVSAVSGHDKAMVQAILGFWAENSQDQVLVDGKENNLESRSSALVMAANGGSMEMVQLLLNTDLNNGAPDRALASAASGGHEKVAQLLLDRGARVNFNMADAANNDDENGVRFLLKTGYSIDYIDYRMMNVLQIASSHGNSNIVQLMIDNGADLNTYGRDRNKDTALITAVSERQNDVVRLLLDSGADVNLHWGGAAGNALHVAAELDFKDVCATLLAHGADINLPSGDPELSPLETAYRNVSAGVVEMLLMHGAKAPDDGFSLTGAFIAGGAQSRSRVQTARVLRLLNLHGVKMDLEGDGTCLPAVHEAARYGNVPVLNELLRLGADVHVWAGEYGNILHTAVSRECYPTFEDDTTEESHAACVATLLDHGLDINSPGKIYKDALTAAIMADPRDFDLRPHPAIALLERGIKIRDNGPELLEMSVVKCLPKVADLLLKRGISIDTSVSYPNLLVAATQSRDPLHMLPLLVDMGADIKSMGPLALGKTFDLYDWGILEWLLERGVSPNAPCDEHPNALISAVAVAEQDRTWGYLIDRKLEVLIQYGADVHTHGPAALELAIANGYGELVRRELGEVVDEVSEPEENSGQADDAHKAEEDSEQAHDGTQDEDE